LGIIGLEMEVLITKSVISTSDNPLESGSTLASGGLGTTGKTYVFDYY
jgi:hypothetical protein